MQLGRSCLRHRHPPGFARSRWRRRAGSRRGPGWREAPPDARPADASGHPRRRRSNRGVNTKIDRQLHDRGQPDRRAHVVAEDQEGRAVGRRCDSAMPLTIAPMACSRMPKWKLRAAVVVRLEDRRRLNVRSWSRARDPPAPPSSHGTLRAMAFSTLPPASRAGHALGIGREVRDVSIPAVGQLAASACGRAPRASSGKAADSVASVRPRLRAAAGRAPDERAVEMLRDAVRHEELRVLGPAVSPLGRRGYRPRPAARRAPCGAGCGASPSR